MELKRCICNLINNGKKKSLLFAIILLLLSITTFAWRYSDGLNKDYIGEQRKIYEDFEKNREKAIQSINQSAALGKIYLECKKNNELIEGYKGWIESIVSADSDEKNISIFANKDSYANKNKRKTRKDYSSLIDIKLVYEPRTDRQIHELLSYELGGWIIFIWISYACITTYKNRKSLIRKIQFTTRNGRGKIAVYELVKIWRDTCFFLMIQYAMLMIVSVFILDKKIAWNIPVQSVSDLNQLNLNMSLGKYVLFYIMIQFLLCCVLVSVLICLLWIWDNYVLAYSVFLLVMGCEWLLYNPSFTIFCTKNPL